MGSDHLLLVKSARLREEYKRFYFRDIQAIVTAAAPRFHISTRSALIAVLWICALAAVNGLERRFNVPFATWVWWTVSVALVLSWIYISAVDSCRCRIYTAVSSEELPSLYRTWTARRFLEKVEPNWRRRRGLSRAIGPTRWKTSRSGRCPRAESDSRRRQRPRPARASLEDGAHAGLRSIRRQPVSGRPRGVADGPGASAGVGRWILLGFLLLQIARRRGRRSAELYG